MKRTKRLLSGLLAVVMVLSLTVQDISVSAAETLDTTFVSANSEEGQPDAIDQGGQNDAGNQNGGTDESGNAGNDESDNIGSTGGINDTDKTEDSEDTDNIGSSDGTENSDNTDITGDSDSTGITDADDDSDNSDGTDSSDDNDSTDVTDNSDEFGDTDEINDSDITDDSDLTDDINDPEQSDDADITDDENLTDDEDESVITSIGGVDWSKCQYILFPDNRDNISYEISKKQTVKTIDYLAPTTLYIVNTSDIEEIEFEASVSIGHKLELPEDLEDVITQKKERKLVERRWIYNYCIDTSELSTTQDEPLSVSLIKEDDEVEVKVNGDANIDGIDEDGMAPVGSVVTIEVLNAGDALAMITEDDKGNTSYTAMELDYKNCYSFTVEKEAVFVVANPDNVSYAIANSSTNKAKLTGEKGLKLNSLASSAQGYQEIVLNFTAVPNGSDGTDTESVYYEVKVAAKPGENMPSGSSEAPKYYYIKKTADVNTQSKSIIVNDGKSENTAWTYEFSVRLVHISKSTKVPNENTSSTSALDVALSGNTIVKSFATKNRYYEDKLGFTKKNVNVYTGQSNVLTGIVKYSKNASYLHNLTAVAYNSEGGVCNDITCSFKNDNDELYVSVDKETIPGKYTIAVYAGSVDSKTATPQSGTMYQANASFALNVSAGINYIDTYGTTERVAVGNNKAISFNVASVGYGGYDYYYKAKTQKFTYEIKSVASGKIVEPTDDVKNNISVNKSGKVTIKKGYTVKASSGEEYIAIVIKAADFAGNTTEKTVKVLVSNKALVPTDVYLTDLNGKKLSGNKFKYDELDNEIVGNKESAFAGVVVLDQYGNNMNQYVTITPNKIKDTANYVLHDANDDLAVLCVNKLGTISIKAVTTDGNKKAKTVKFTVSMPTYTKPVYNEKAVVVTCGGVIVDNKPEDGAINYDAPGNSEVRFTIGAQALTGALYNRNLIDWQYSITGGKLKFDGDYWVVTTTAKTAQLKIWFKSNPFRTWSLKFVNNGWNAAKYDSAPKITLKDGQVYTNRLSTVNANSQQLTYSYDSGSFNKIVVTKTSTKIPDVSIDPDKTSTTNKTFTLNFDKGDIKAGSYKYNIVFMNGNNIACKPVTITVKVKKTPKIKITASYTLNTAQADSSITLKCTPKDLGFSSSAKLLNANVKGQANDFSKYFNITVKNNTEGVPTATIKLNEKYKEELKGKTITGYVKYDYYLGYSHVENVTSKITIKVK